MGQGMHVPGAGQMPQAGPFDMGYGQDQQRLLLARAGSDPTLGFANIPSEAPFSCCHVLFAQPLPHSMANAVCPIGL